MMSVPNPIIKTSLDVEKNQCGENGGYGDPLHDAQLFPEYRNAGQGHQQQRIYPGQMVDSFENWCYDAARKAGDTGIVESEYGYHVMYFCGDSETVYRDYLIENDLRKADLDAWYAEIVAAMTQTEGDTSYIRKDVVLSAS